MIEKKRELRKEIARRKNEFSSMQLIEMSSSVIENLEKLEVFQKAKVVLVYYSMPDEVDTTHLIEKYKNEKNIVLPIVTKQGLIVKEYLGEDKIIVSKYGIKEPMGDEYLNYDDIDLVVVPGVAFDKNLNRMGRGKGYYDGLLPKIKAPKVSICFDFQIVDNVPVDNRDVMMDLVVCETTVY